MSIVLWVFQALLAALFLAAGGLKIARPLDALTGLMPWVEDFSRLQVIGIGSLEILGAAGLVLPGITRIAPVLTPIAAIGLAILMVGATVTHLVRGEAHLIAGNIVVIVIAAVVAWGRLVSWPL
ncbi:DoxX family protein [Microtetraspora fusca]|uniref:DoxX family protein n=1 Tax=Microtetraspora fusca TaxID=1997 RepID=UPI00082E5F54|nr:DoxX family protein [Microtetraspora fusca]